MLDNWDIDGGIESQVHCDGDYEMCVVNVGVGGGEGGGLSSTKLQKKAPSRVSLESTGELRPAIWSLVSNSFIVPASQCI